MDMPDVRLNPEWMSGYTHTGSYLFRFPSRFDKVGRVRNKWPVTKIRHSPKINDDSIHFWVSPKRFSSVMQDKSPVMKIQHYPKRNDDGKYFWVEPKSHRPVVPNEWPAMDIHYTPKRNDDIVYFPVEPTSFRSVLQDKWPVIEIQYHPKTNDDSVHFLIESENFRPKLIPKPIFNQSGDEKETEILLDQTVSMSTNNLCNIFSLLHHWPKPASLWIHKLYPYIFPGQSHHKTQTGQDQWPNMLSVPQRNNFVHSTIVIINQHENLTSSQTDQRNNTCPQNIREKTTALYSNLSSIPIEDTQNRNTDKKELKLIDVQNKNKLENVENQQKQNLNSAQNETSTISSAPIPFYPEQASCFPN